LRNLREDLIEHYDFEALYPSIWTHLYSWYSADTQIARYLKADSMITSDHPNNLELSEPINLLSFDVSHNKKFELDLYPTTLTEKMF
jgi:hypothetical protein